MDQVLKDLSEGRYRRTQAGLNTSTSGSGKNMMKLIETAGVG